MGRMRALVLVITKPDLLHLFGRCNWCGYGSANLQGLSVWTCAVVQLHAGVFGFTVAPKIYVTMNI